MHCTPDSGDETLTPALQLTPTVTEMLVGETVQLSVGGATGPVVWSSSDVGVATVEFGQVSALGPGSSVILAVSGNESAQTTITVTRPAQLVLSADRATFAAVAGADAPPAATIGITNGGDHPVDGLAVGTITYTAGAEGWLAATLEVAASPATLTLRPNTTGLTPGIYTATVPLTSTTAVNSPVSVTVTYQVAAAPVIVLGAPGASFTAQQGAAAPAAQGIAITNGGSGTLAGLSVGAIGYGAGASGWLTAGIDPTTAPATLTLQPGTTTLAPGTYTATVPLSSSVPGVAPVTVDVTYQVTTAPVPPAIVLSTAALGFTTTAGSALPASQRVSIANGGEGTLDGLAVSVAYAAGQPAGWLAAPVLSSGTAPATLDVRPNTTGLAAGTYTATVSVSSPAASNSPRTVTVSYTVQSQPAIGLGATARSFEARRASVNPPSQTVSVTNTGGGTLSGLAVGSVSYSGGASGWLGATLDRSTAPATLTLAVTTGAIVPGSYTATVTITGTGVSSRTVTVTFQRTATLTDDVQDIFNDHGCKGCHDGSSTSIPDYTDATTSWNTLLGSGSGAPATGCPGLGAGRVRVKPGEPSNSCLYLKVSGAVSHTGPTLTGTDLTTIYTWILQGAARQP